MLTMEIQEIKIDGVVYVPTDSYNCANCAFVDRDCCLNGGEYSIDIEVCDVFEGRPALKVKED